MAYTVAFTNFIDKGNITVEDNTVNTETSLGLPGRSSTAYGTAVAENFLHLLENFASSDAPINPVEGQLWYDTSDAVSQLKIYDGTSWVASGGLKKATTEPDVVSSLAGDLWADTDNQQLYLFTGSGWVLVGPSFSDGLATGITPLSIVDTTNITHTVLQVQVEARTVAIISTASFTPKTVITGFVSIKPGVNLSLADIAGSGFSKFIGTSEKAENLIVGSTVVSASNFLRSDVVSTTNAALRVKDNSGIELGASLPLSLGIEGNSAVITHSTPGSNIDIRINNAGTLTTAIRINSDTNVGINQPNPDESLDVLGNAKVSESLFVDGTTDSLTFSTGAAIIKGGAGIAKDLNVGGNARISGSSTFANIIPDVGITNIERNLGSLTSTWNSVYANNFRGNVIGNVSGAVSGRAGSSDKLTSVTTFKMQGDVSAAEFVFDGQTGSNIKTFTTAISNAFISNKSAVSSTLPNDELLLNRITGTPGLFRVSRINLLKSVPVNPIGVYMPYAGDIAPPGWLLCNGEEVSKSTYADLFAVIQFKFKDASLVTGGGVLLFALPDMRGRVPLGADTMGSAGAANIVTDAAADQVGTSGGSEAKDVRRRNLPQHNHDMRASNGDQFYAISDVNGGVLAPEAISYDAPTGTNDGQALATSGNMRDGGQTGLNDYRTEPGDHSFTGEELGTQLNVMNPFVASNYIIYHGVV